MNHLLDAFWRAAAYCLHPKVIFLSLAPLLLAGGVTFALGWFFWEPAVAGVQAALKSWSLIDTLLQWIEGYGATGLRALLAPAMLMRLQQAVIDNRNVFEVLMEAVRVCSLGQITNALFEVGGQYRRSM